MAVQFVGVTVQIALAGLLLAPSAMAHDAAPLTVPTNTQDAKDVLSTPESALQSIHVPDGFRVSLFAAEPDVQQPVGMAFDERGRVWIAEMYTYGDSKERFSKSLRDRVVIFEDADGDGRFDKRKVFWDQGQKLTSVEVGFGGAWVLCAPQFMFIPDRNHDDIPDGPPEVLLDGFNDDFVGHNIVNGLKWGPDGWLYGRHGIQATSSVGIPGASESQRTRINCSMWRYHPTRRVFEVVAEGTTNSWGADWDDHGQMFFINTVIGHLWHVIPGAHYRRMYGADFNPYTYELIEQTADHVHWDRGEAWGNAKKKAISAGTSRAGGGHAHSGMSIYLGDNWPEQYRNTVLTVNMHGRRLNNDRLERHGAGYVGKHGEDLFQVDDPWFRGVEVCYGPDGGVYVLDWTDVGECHESDGVHRTSGRIFKATYGTPRPTGPFDLAKLGNAELVALQLRKNDWYVRQARRLLHERAVAGQDMSDAVRLLNSQLREHADVTRQLRALWCLWSIDAAPQKLLVTLLQHESEHLRTWAVKLLCDHGPPSRDAMAALVSLARHEPSGLVQLFLASALQRLPLNERWPLAKALTERGEFADDPVLPLMIWYGVEPAVISHWSEAVALAESSRAPLVRRHIARRLTSDFAHRSSAINALLERLVRHDEADFCGDILQGMVDALRGRHRAPKPAAWDAVAMALGNSDNDSVRTRVRDLSVVFGDGRAVDELRKIVDTPKADVESRRQALATLIEARVDRLEALLIDLVDDQVLANDAIRGLAAFDGTAATRVILRAYPRLDPDGRAAAVATFASRPAYARLLLDAVADGRIPRRDVSAFHARQIQSFGDESLTQQLSTVWGETRTSDAEKQRLIADAKRALSAERLAQADLSAGRLAFEKTCATCHVLYGQGKAVGPDLTGGNRNNLDYLLENLLDPSAAVAADFRMAVVVLESGRVVTGVVVAQSEQTITLQTQTERVTIERSEIDEQKPTTESLMPEGLLKTLAENQVRDLIAYLMSPQQVALPPDANNEASPPPRK